MIPGMVLSSFTSELFMKCLILIEGKSPKDEHHLSRLFEMLHSNTKEQLRSLWSAEVAWNELEFQENERKFNATIPRDLDSALMDCGNSFVLMRYLYEDPKRAKFYIVDLPSALRNLIRERMPSWEPSKLSIELNPHSLVIEPHNHAPRRGRPLR